MKNLLRLFERYNAYRRTPYSELRICDDGSGKIVQPDGTVMAELYNIEELEQTLNSLEK